MAQAAPAPELDGLVAETHVFDEKRAVVNAEAKAQVALLWSALSRREIWQPALFVGFFLATPSADSAFLYFLTDDLGFSQEFLGRVSLGGSVASIAGITIYQRYLRSVRVSQLLLWTTLACLPFGLLQLALVTTETPAIQKLWQGFKRHGLKVLTTLINVSDWTEGDRKRR